MFQSKGKSLALTEGDLAGRIHKSLCSSGVTERDSERIVKSIFEIISQALGQESRVNVGRFVLFG